MEEASKSIDYFSKIRFARYLSACNNNPELARQLYHANGMLSNAFRLLLTDYLEVFLRNALDYHLAIYFQDDYWLCTKYEQCPGITNVDVLLEAKKRLRHINYTHDDLVTALTFGFWTELFYPTQYKALKGRPIKIFTNKPKNKKFNQSRVYNQLKRVRQFRNRITHGEPIVFAKNKALINLRYSKQTHFDIYEILNWLHPSLVQKMKQWDSVEREIKRVLEIKDKI